MSILPFVRVDSVLMVTFLSGSLLLASGTATAQSATPTDVEVPNASDRVAPHEPLQTDLATRVWRSIGFLHPAIAHFPIALFSLGAVFVVLGWKWPSLTWS